jgi:5-methyltetrahydrofolate--homocysteine methyltransferase
MMATFQSLLSENEYILADGAMGTMLFASGLEHGDSPDKWNLDHPEKVAAIHRAYLEAGAQLLLTNTFGGTRYRLALHGLEERVGALNRAAAEILRAEVSASGREALVAGDIGPSGQVMAPYGELTFSDAVAAFREQASALMDSGVDLIWIETMADLAEMRAAVEAVRAVSPEVPVLATMTFDTHGRTMMGVTPEKAASSLIDLDVAAIGGNCGNGPDEIITVIQKMRATTPEAVLVAKANAGVPQLVNGKPVYRATPEDMAGYAIEVFAAGARVIGACCGSTPAHIQAIAQALASHKNTG